MTHIPTPDEINAQDRERHARAVNMFIDGLVDALNGRNFYPTFPWRFEEAIIADARTQFLQAGWVVTKIGESRSDTIFQITRA